MSADPNPPAPPPTGRGATDEPVPLTEDEVMALAGRRVTAASIVRRLTTLRPAAPTGRLISESEAPARITTNELAAIRRARRSTAVAHARFSDSDAPAEAKTEPRDRKSRPARSPTPR
jgi:hypothetical protein